MRQKFTATRGHANTSTTPPSAIPRQQQIFQKIILWASECIQKIPGLRTTDKSPIMTDAQPAEGEVAAAAAPGTLTRKLPPLDVRPFKPDDYTQIRQLIADSTHLPFWSQINCRYIATGTTCECPHLLPPSNTCGLGGVFCGSRQSLRRAT